MSGAFLFVGGAATNILAKITTTSATSIAGNANYAIHVPWFKVTEIAGGTATLTVDVYDGTTAYYLRNAVAMTAKGEYLFDYGIFLGPGQFIRVTTSSANAADVVGVSSLPNTQL